MLAHLGRTESAPASRIRPRPSGINAAFACSGLASSSRRECHERRRPRTWTRPCATPRRTSGSATPPGTRPSATAGTCRPRRRSARRADHGRARRRDRAGEAGAGPGHQFRRPGSSCSVRPGAAVKRGGQVVKGHPARLPSRRRRELSPRSGPPGPGAVTRSYCGLRPGRRLSLACSNYLYGGRAAAGLVGLSETAQERPPVRARTRAGVVAAVPV